MKRLSAREKIKREVGYAAADRYVGSGMKVGLGTGSTAIWAVKRIGEKLASGAIGDVIAVATSTQTEMECQRLGIPLRAMNDPQINGRLDLTIDGADEVDPALRLVKGGGGALLAEKIAAYNSARFVVVVEGSKLVSHLALAFPLPIEVLPSARVPVTRAIGALGGEGEVRTAVRKMGAVITDNGNILLDVRFHSPIDPAALEREINAIPGVIENGFFTLVRPLVLVGNGGGEVAELA